jgi:hypothetical protein
LASLTLFFAEHEVIDNERAIRFGEEIAQTDGVRRRIASLKVARALFKLIILNHSTFRKIATHLSDAFAVTHQLDFGEAQLFALGQVLSRFVG